ncbi:hypothetical protein [Stutzerimonas chloritidismutans]|uniref:hypothetical protein n=1 Tax=Stutzerimonas chloritidismutans TaxID=203192 RepID=UPI003F1645F8
MPDLFQALLLTVSAAASAVALGLARRGHAEPNQPALFGALLALTLAATSGGCAVARLAFGLDTLHAERWLFQATLLLGLPMAAAAAVALSRGWVWSRPTWGRVVIGLCVFFELARRLDRSDEYAALLALASALLVAYAGLVQWPHHQKTLAGLVAGALMLFSASWNGLVFNNPLADYQRFCLALLCPLLAWFVPTLASRHHQGDEMRPTHD